MPNKFFRNYVMKIQATTGGDIITIKPPFTVEFDVQRQTLATNANNGHFRIYNLSQLTRNLILKNEFDYDDQRLITFEAGYGEDPAGFPVVFTGNMTKAGSVREGSSFVTTIEAFDGGYASANASINDQFVAGTSNQDILEKFIEGLSEYGVSAGAIGTIAGVSTRGNAYSGGAFDIIRDFTGGGPNSGFFIDNGKANFLQDTEVIAAAPIVVNSASGLLGTPYREAQFLIFDILFEPRVSLGTLINLQTTEGPDFSGIYKVISIHHRGTISDAVCGDAITTIGIPYVKGVNYTPVQSQT